MWFAYKVLRCIKISATFHPPTDVCINNQTDLDFLIQSKLLTLGWPFSSCSLSLLMTPSAVWTSTSPLAALSWWPDTRFIQKAVIAWPQWLPTSIMATVWLSSAPRVDGWRRWVLSAVFVFLWNVAALRSWDVYRIGHVWVKWRSCRPFTSDTGKRFCSQTVCHVSY